MTQDKNKQAAAHAAIEHIPFDAVVGVGTGSTVNYFIEALAAIKGKIKGTVASSHASKALLKAANLPVMDLNYAGEVDIYIDGADEIDPHGRMIKGGGGALTGEKIVASCAKKFICIVDEKKCVPYLGGFPVAVEVIELARSAVARAIVKMGGSPFYREGFVSDYGHIILDVEGLVLEDPQYIETALNQIPGVVANGIFSYQSADMALIGAKEGVDVRDFSALKTT